MQLEAILKAAVDGDASDVHFKVGLPPVLRVHGHLYPFAQCPALGGETLLEFATSVCPAPLLERLQHGGGIDFAHSFPGVGRFRVHVFRTRGNVGLVLHHVPGTIRSLRELHLPPEVEEIGGAERGLVVVAGDAGTGKSTTAAALVEHVNRRRTSHIVTIEDPMEYLFTDNHSVIDQREIGTDSASFAEALRSVDRQDANVVMVSALPDLEAVEAALRLCESGRLVIAVVSGPGGQTCLERLAEHYAPGHKNAALRRLADAIVGVIHMQLVPTPDGTSRRPEVDVLRELSVEPITESSSGGPPAPPAPRSGFGEGERWFSPE